MGPRPGAVRSVCLRLIEVKRDIETRKVNEARLWQYRRKPNSANVLNGHLIFAPVDSRKVWRRSWINDTEKYRTARTLREFWDGSPFGIGKWPHMLPVVPTRASHSWADVKKIRLLKALQLDDPYMIEIQDDVNQDVNVNQTDPQEDAPPMVAKTDPYDDWRAVDLNEDGFLT